MYVSRIAGHLYFKAVMGMLLANCFTQSAADHCLLTRRTDRGPIHVCLSIDDFVVASASHPLIDYLAALLNSKYQLK